LLVDDAAVEPTYRYNIMLYVDEALLASLPERCAPAASRMGRP